LTAVHPSPLAGGGFAGCNHFALANELLAKQGKQPIDWQV
jgi:uracil-DNA glycosylase